MKSLFIKNWYFYSIGLIIIYGLKLYYSTASVNDLDWILAPTAWWTQILSGNTFEKVSNIGYLNNANEFIIVSSCSGMNFLMILFSTLLYSFIHRWNTFRQKLLWFFFSMVIAYILTIGVNGLRIVLAMHLFNADIYGNLVTPQRIHRIEGIAVYFFSLFTIFLIIDSITEYSNPRLSQNSEAEQHQSLIKNLIKPAIYPVFWYLLMTLGIPVLNRAYKTDTSEFLEHSIVIILICLTGIVLYYLSALIKNRSKNISISRKSV
jgi:exosortase K